MMLAFFLISFCFNVLLAIALSRFITRARQLDDIMNLVTDDVSVFTEYLFEQLKKPTFSNSDEIKSLYRNMREMSERFVNFIENAESARNLSDHTEDKKENTQHNPPVFVD